MSNPLAMSYTGRSEGYHYYSNPYTFGAAGMLYLSDQQPNKISRIACRLIIAAQSHSVDIVSQKFSFQQL